MTGMVAVAAVERQTTARAKSSREKTAPLLLFFSFFNSVHKLRAVDRSDEHPKKDMFGIEEKGARTFWWCLMLSASILVRLQCVFVVCMVRLPADSATACDDTQYA